MPTSQVPPEERPAREAGPILLTGIQALARLPIAQAQRDRRAGLATAGFVSGYRGFALRSTAPAERLYERPVPVRPVR